MNEQGQLLVDPADYLKITSSKKAFFKGADDSYENVKARVYHDPSVNTDTDHLKISSHVLDFVVDGISFDEQVVKSKAPFTLPYNKKYVEQIFDDKCRISDDLKIEKWKYRTKNEHSAKLVEQMREKKSQLAIADGAKSEEKRKKVQFKPVGYFVDDRKMSLSDGDLTDFKKVCHSNTSKSSENIGGFFLTEINEQVQVPKTKMLREKIVHVENYDWDDFLIDSLSENTARWIVMKQVSDPKRKQKLQALVESKFGRYMRNIDELELGEDSYTEFEKRKMLEEKERVRQEKNPSQSLSQSTMADEKGEDRQEVRTPLYRLPQGLKRIELENLKKPDPSYNKTASSIQIEPSRVQSPKNYTSKMHEKNLSDNTLLKTGQPYTNEILGGNSKHIFSKEKNKIYLENGKTFTKMYQCVYPAEFTAWLNGVKVVETGKPEKPVKGLKKWKKYPELIDNYKMNKPSDITETDNFWHLLPNVTPDTELRKALKSNFTVAKIVQEWRHKWQTSNRWTLAEIEELIRDMKNDEANVRFQAVVVCSRAVEKAQLLIDKLANFSQKHPKKYKSEELGEEFKDLYKQRSELTFGKASSLNQKQQMYLNDIIFSEKLFETIENLLNDSNFKVKLAAAIGIFVIMKKFARPYTQKYQLCKDKAERVLRDAMKTLGTTDKYTAALCLGKDGFIDETIIGILLTNYFESNEQYTKEQVTQCLSDLSSHNLIVHRKIEAHLESEHVRERILTCKLIPCLKTALTKKIVAKLMDLMWNDVNHNVKKVAAQTLGRTGRGKEVHDQLFRKLHSVNLFERISALKIINHIGIMTQKLLEVFLKCFRDDYMSIRQMACVCCQRLFEKDEKIIDALVFVARFDPVSKLKALAIRTLGLIGVYNESIRNALMWALQFESDPITRTEACHSTILLINQKDQQLVEILLDRHLVEEDTMVRNEIMDALIHLGYDPKSELPLVTKIKNDVKKLNDKNEIISKILEIEKEREFEFEKKRLIWDENEKEETKADSSREKLSQSSSDSFGPFEPRLIEKSAKKNLSKKSKRPNETSFLSRLVQQETKEVTSSRNSFNLDFFIDEFTAESKKSLSSQRIRTIAEEH